jgi:hypothetical protein
MLQVSTASTLGLVILDSRRENPFAARMQRVSRGRAVGDGRGRPPGPAPEKLEPAVTAPNPHVVDCKLKPDPKAAADTAARQDVFDRKLAYKDIENKQAHYRAAQFILSAAKHHPKGSEIFQIREIYLFKFKSKEEPLPAALEHIKKVVESKSLIMKMAKRIEKLKPLVEKIELFSKTLDNALGPEGKLAMIMIKFMVPQELDSCYEIKNSEHVHAQYRMNGTGHKKSFGLTDVLDIVSESIAATKWVIKAIKTVLGAPTKLDKAIQFLEKFYRDLHKEPVLRRSSSRRCRLVWPGLRIRGRRPDDGGKRRDSAGDVCASITICSLRLP